MRTLISLLGLLTLCGCTSFGGVLSSETTWFQDWSCQRQDGVCARTDQIDTITIAELDGDPAEAGPVSGYPVEELPLSATPELLQNVRPLDRDYFEDEIERGRPFLETTFADEQVESVDAILASTSSTNTIDELMGGSSMIEDEETSDPFVSAFPKAAVFEQFAALEEKVATTEIKTAVVDISADPALPNKSVPMVLASAESFSSRASDALNDFSLEAVRGVRSSAESKAQDTETATSDGIRTRVVVSRNGVPIPEEEQVVELVEGSVEEHEAFAKVLAAESGPDAEPSMEERAPKDTPNDKQMLRAPDRSPGKILPVLISAYVDARGIFHERKVIWLEVESADWVLD
ncbi:MAG: hypothetical protein AAFW60_01455 [Pseudomonadota bacterium]